MIASDRRDKMAAFTMQGEDLPQPTNRVDLDPTVRDVWGLPSGRITYNSHPHDVACARHWAPRLVAVMQGAGATHTMWVTSPGIPDSFAPHLPPISRHWMGTTRMGVDPVRVGLRSRATPLGRRQRRDRRLLGVPDFLRLRPDAHARRTRDPRRPDRSLTTLVDPTDSATFFLGGRRGRGYRLGAVVPTRR